MDIRRSEFIGLGLAFAAFAGCKTGISRSPAPRMRLGCQMWSIKELWGDDMTATFPKLKAMGYEGVQSMAFWKLDPVQLEKNLSANGLALADMPISFEHVEGENLGKTVDFCHRFGVDFVYIPWFKGKTATDWRAFCDRLDAVGEQLKKEGIRVGYHNHLHEFTTPVDGVLPCEILASDPRVNLEMDIGPIAESGRCSQEWIMRFSKRIPGLHAKPYGATAAGRPGDRQDWPKIVAAARSAGVHWFVVECEQRKNTFEDVAASAAYLKPLLVG